MIQLDTLGAVDLRRDGMDVRSVLAQPRRLALLVYLATARPRGYHSRERLLGLFWPDADAERARNSLRQALHQLRRSLGEDVLVGRGEREIGIDPGALRCDAAAFDDAIEAGRPDLALQLYRGDFLPGFFVVGAPEVERFVEDERARYRRAACAAAWALASADEERGDLRSAALYARRALALDPYDEAGLRRALSVLDGAGERAAAVQLFDDFARRLEMELGVEPAAETLRQVGRLRATTERMVSESTEVSETEPATTAGELARAPSTQPLQAARLEAAGRSSSAAAVPMRASARWLPRGRLLRPALVMAALLLLVALGGRQIRRFGTAELPAGADAVSSIAVLPFVNMSGDPANEYLSDGMAEELMYLLSRVPRLNVVGHTSAFSYKGKDVGIDSIGRALRVGHVLEGSVRVTGGRVRVLATLIDARSGYHVWSETYDGQLEDVLTLQDRIAAAIVRALQPRFAAVTTWDETRRPETIDAEAHADLLRGLQALRLGGPDDYDRAHEYLSRALRRDSTYARAHAGLAGVEFTLSTRGLQPRAEGIARAVASAERALALDPTESDAHVVLGRIAQDYRWEFEIADRHFRRAIELGPGDEATYRQRARLFSILGRSDEAIQFALRSTDLDPLAPTAHRFLGLIYVHARRYQAALDALHRALALAPDHPYSLAYGSYALTALGRHEEAVRATERALEQAPNEQMVLAAAAAAHAGAGDTASARAMLARLEAQPLPSPYLIALAHAALGDREQSFQALDRAVAERDAFLIELEVAPTFDPLRTDPRMEGLLQRIGLR